MAPPVPATPASITCIRDHLPSQACCEFLTHKTVNKCSGDSKSFGGTYLYFQVVCYVIIDYLMNWFCKPNVGNFLRKWLENLFLPFIPWDGYPTWTKRILDFLTPCSQGSVCLQGPEVAAGRLGQLQSLGRKWQGEVKKTGSESSSIGKYSLLCVLLTSHPIAWGIWSKIRNICSLKVAGTPVSFLHVLANW